MNSNLALSDALTDHIKLLPVGHLHLSQRAYNALSKVEITSISELLKLSMIELRGIRSLGRTAIEDIVDSQECIRKSINERGEIIWDNYWQARQITILPELINSRPTPAEMIEKFPGLVREILVRGIDEKAWEIVKQRFGLENAKKPTLEEIGGAYGLTRERVRQLERNALAELSHVLIEDQYSGKTYHVHPAILAIVKQFFDQIPEKIRDFIIESHLFQLASDTFGPISKKDPSMHLLFQIVGLNRITFDDVDLEPVWEYAETGQRKALQNAIVQILTLFTKDSSTPLGEFKVLSDLNKSLPKNEKLTLQQVRRYLELCSAVEQLPDGRYQGRFESLKSPGSQIERILSEKGCQMHYREITREMNTRNTRLNQKWSRTQSTKNLVYQLSTDDRFVPIGRSGKWALRAWEGIETRPIVVIMEEYLTAIDKPATVDEIYDYVSKRRSAEKSSIAMHLTGEDQFKKIDRHRWGLSLWDESDDVKVWNPEQVADFVADIFRKRKTREIEFKIVKQELMNAADVSAKQAQGLLNGNPVIRTRRADRWGKVTYAIFDPNYESKLANREKQFRRKTLTGFEKLRSVVRDILEAEAGKQMELSSLMSILKKTYGYHEKTAYLYISRLDYIEKIDAPDTKSKICRIKEARHPYNLSTSPTPRHSERNIMTRNYLNAAGKAVKTLAGPFGAPLEFLLSLYDDERKEEKERKLNALLESNQSLTQDTLSTVLETRSDLQITHQVLLEMLRALFEQVRKLDKQEMENILLSPKVASSMSIQLGFSEQAVVDELIHLFGGDTGLFLAIIRTAGFPTENLKTNEAARTLISGFVDACRGLSPQRLADTFSSLYSRKEGSEVLAKLSAMYGELTMVKQNSRPNERPRM